MQSDAYKSVFEYDESKVKFRQMVEERRKKMRVVIKPSEAVTGESNMGHKVTYVVSPVNGFDIQTIETFIGEIPPMSRTGMHRHNVEAAIYVLEGKGYSIIDDKKYEWQKGDGICIPSMSWHQHFNPSKTEPAKYLACTTVLLLQKIGLMYMEEKEGKGFLDKG